MDTAASAAEALARTNWAAYSAIILDRRLPDGNAEQLLPRLKDVAPDAAVIVVTGYSDLQGAIAALRQGATDYILKPLNADASAPAWPASPSGGTSPWPRNGARPPSATWSRPPSA